MKRLLPLLLSLGACARGGPAEPPMERIRVAPGGRGFTLETSGRPWVPWGFNYDHDAQSRLLEDYWGSDWDRVVEDFQEMKALGANVVRIHLQLHRFLKSADGEDEAELDRLGRLLQLAEATGLRLDITGLASYRKALAPPWYVQAPERARWALQARFWEAVAKRCASSPAVFCYSLMNEPVSPAGPSKEFWEGELGGFSYVERLTLDPGTRSRPEVTRQWMDTLIPAIRKFDPRRPITCGVFYIFDVAGGLTLGPDPREIAAPLDFLSVHLYPKSGKVDTALRLLKLLESAGKPVLIQEMFALSCGLPEFRRFLDGSRATASGWISFYWGRTAEEYRRSNEMKDALMVQWLDFIREAGPAFRD